MQHIPEALFTFENEQNAKKFILKALQCVHQQSLFDTQQQQYQQEQQEQQEQEDNSNTDQQSQQQQQDDCKQEDDDNEYDDDNDLTSIQQQWIQFCATTKSQFVKEQIFNLAAVDLMRFRLRFCIQIYTKFFLIVLYIL